jgi:hypothetical protein
VPIVPAAKLCHVARCHTSQLTLPFSRADQSMPPRAAARQSAAQPTQRTRTRASQSQRRRDEEEEEEVEQEQDDGPEEIELDGDDEPSGSQVCPLELYDAV